MLHLDLTTSYLVNVPILLLSFCLVVFGVTYILVEGYEVGARCYANEPCPFMHWLYESLLVGCTMIVSGIACMIYGVGGIVKRIKTAKFIAMIIKKCLIPETWTFVRYSTT